MSFSHWQNDQLTQIGTLFERIEKSKKYGGFRIHQTHLDRIKNFPCLPLLPNAIERFTFSFSGNSDVIGPSLERFGSSKSRFMPSVLLQYAHIRRI